MPDSRPRRIEPEWLDELPPDDPRATRSRHDLRRVNMIMLQAGIMRRQLMSVLQGERPRSVLELGGGDGTFMLIVARRLAPIWPSVTLTLLDRQPVVAAKTRDAFLALGWKLEVITADIFEFLQAAKQPAADVAVANLFLHHFTDAQLARLLAGTAASTPRFVACEPRRSARALGACRLLWAIGCNDVSRHDALASVRAGFHGAELSALWPKRSGWQLSERPAGLFSHSFVASRANAMGAG